MIPGEPVRRIRRKKSVSWGDVEVFKYSEQAAVAGIVVYDSTGAVVDGESEWGYCVHPEAIQWLHGNLTVARNVMLNAK
jgi:hypothetical protein